MVDAGTKLKQRTMSDDAHIGARQAQASGDFVRAAVFVIRHAQDALFALGELFEAARERIHVEGPNLGSRSDFDAILSGIPELTARALTAQHSCHEVPRRAEREVGDSRDVVDLAVAQCADDDGERLLRDIRGICVSAQSAQGVQMNTRREQLAQVTLGGGPMRASAQYLASKLLFARCFAVAHGGGVYQFWPAVR